MTNPQTPEDKMRSPPACGPTGLHSNSTPRRLRDLHLHRQLFADDKGRAASALRSKPSGLYFDYSKNRITEETMRLLIGLAELNQVCVRVSMPMFAGEKINVTENRAVLHVALRAPASEKIFVDGAMSLYLTFTRCSTRWKNSPAGSERRAWKKPYRQAHSQHRQCGHRRAPISALSWPSEALQTLQPARAI